MDYRSLEKLWSFADDRLAVRFADRYRHDSARILRGYDDPMTERFVNINECPVDEAGRRFRRSFGRRPDVRPILGDLGF